VKIPFYKLLQHGSSVLGRLVLVFAFLKLPKTADPIEKINMTYWFAAASLILLIIAARLLTGLNYRQYGDSVATIISAGFIALIVTPQLIRPKR
jgi:hypothetical protein